MLRTACVTVEPSHAGTNPNLTVVNEVSYYLEIISSVALESMLNGWRFQPSRYRITVTIK